MNKTTEQMRLGKIREKLQEKCDAGLLGIVAAQSRCAESELRAWCQDASKVPHAAIVTDVAHYLAREHYLKEARDAVGGDPYNSTLGESWKTIQ